MFDHVKFGVSDLAASKAFFLKALEPLGVDVVDYAGPTGGVEIFPKGQASLCLFQTREKPAHLHLAFRAESRRQVEAFHRAALEAGGTDNGAPGLRPHYHAGYYAAFVIGPDGHNIEMVCHVPHAQAGMAGDFDPAGFAQRQLDAYNDRDLERFIREYTDDVVAYRLPGAAPLVSGKAAFAEHYRKNRFTLPGLRAELVNRMVFGNKVIDQERVSGVEAEPIDVAAIYEVTPSGISKVWFVGGK